MRTTLPIELFADYSVVVDTTDYGRRDGRDWRNVASQDRPKRTRKGPRRQATRKDAVRAHLRSL